MKVSIKFLLPLLPVFLLFCSCNELDDTRVPSMAAYVDLSNQGVWNTYGVHGFGEFNNFIFTSSIHQPAGFPYTYNSATGYGGILLIYGQNAFSGEVGPLAYDLSCPVERLQDVRVYIDLESLEAVCPECGSRYDVIEAGGAPISGLAQVRHYALSHYECYATNTGGYIISR